MPLVITNSQKDQKVDIEWSKQVYISDNNEMFDQNAMALSKKIIWKMLPEPSKRTLFHVVSLYSWLQDIKTNHQTNTAIQNILTIHHLKNIFPQLTDDEASAIKLFLCTNSASDWQEVILNISMVVLVDNAALMLTFPQMQWAKDDFDSRFHITKKTSQVGNQAYLLFGSSYAQYNTTHNQTLVMDAGLIAEVADRNQEVTSAVICVADGYGGHVDPDEDKMIAYAAKTATTLFTKLVASFDNPDHLAIALNQIIAFISHEIKTTAKGSTASFVGARIFKNTNELRVVGFGLGDCMLSAFVPNKNRMETLGVGYSTAMGPAELVQYNSNDVRPFDCTVNSDAIIMAMSDGVYADQSWTHTLEKDRCKTYTVNSEKFKNTFFSDPNTPPSSAKQLFSWMTRKLKHSWQDEAERLSEAKRKMGDDVTLALFQFDPTGTNNASSATADTSTAGTSQSPRHK